MIIIERVGYLYRHPKPIVSLFLVVYFDTTDPYPLYFNNGLEELNSTVILGEVEFLSEYHELDVHMGLSSWDILVN